MLSGRQSGKTMRNWMQRTTLMTATLVALAACASNGDTPGASDTVPTTSSETTSSSLDAPPTTATVAGGEETSTTGESTNPPPQIEGPAAPDFTFALADGSTFSLSDEQKPVYLVFWAEW